MIHPFKGQQLLLAFGIVVSLIACNGGETKEPAATTDSAAAVVTDSVKPVVKEAATDAVSVDPGLYKVLHDTLGIKITEATYKPGDSSAMHSHPDYALYVLEGGSAAFYTKEGTRAVSEMKTGMINVKAAEFHSVKNIGKTTIKVLLVEVNRSGAAVAVDAAMDPTKVAGNLYKSVRDTMGIRVLIATYKPGQSSALHSHPDLALYAISGGTGEFTGKDGKKITNELKTGMSAFSPADKHSVKNIGKTTMKVFLVEVSRPAK